MLEIPNQKVEFPLDNTCNTCYNIIVRRKEHERQRPVKSAQEKRLGS